jgi:hypothetical protein
VTWPENGQQARHDTMVRSVQASGLPASVNRVKRFDTGRGAVIGHAQKIQIGSVANPIIEAAGK